MLTANPGGNSIPNHHPTASCESGCAYRVETWGTSATGAHKLQIQVQRLFDAISEVSTAGLTTDGSRLMEQSLIGYFIPFRSPRLKLLHRPKESLAFAKQLWAEMLQIVHPRLFIALDPAAYTGINDACEAIGGVQVSSEAVPTGWGNVTAELDEFKYPDRSVMTLRLPHLSTFQLFSRPECRPHVREILMKACRYL